MTSHLSEEEEGVALNCEEARQEISAYLNRDLEGIQRVEVESHLVACEGCLDEVEYMQMVVAGLRAMPAVRPPQHLCARALTRWREFQAHPERFPFAQAPVPSDLPGIPPTGPRLQSPPLPEPPRPTTIPSAGVEPPIRETRAGRWAPWLARPYNAFALAMLAVVFVTGLFTGQVVRPERLDQAAMAGLLQAMPLDEVARQAMPVDLRAGGADGMCRGQAGKWNPACFQMIWGRALEGVEVQIAVPPGLVLKLDDERFQPAQVVQIKTPRQPDGQWEGRLRWRAREAGEYPTWVEIRSEGVYRRLPIRFVALP